MLKRVQRENPLLLVILRNIRFSFHLAMLEKSRRRARALAKTRVDKPSWVKRSKEIGVFVLGRKGGGGGVVEVACPRGFPWLNEHGNDCYASCTFFCSMTARMLAIPFHPTKSRLWTRERKRPERRTPVCAIRLLRTCSQSCRTVSSLYGNTHRRLT